MKVTSRGTSLSQIVASVKRTTRSHPSTSSPSWYHRLGMSPLGESSTLQDQQKMFGHQILGQQQQFDRPPRTRVPRTRIHKAQPPRVRMGDRPSGRF